MNTSRIVDITNDIDSAVNLYADLTGSNIDRINEQIKSDAEVLALNLEVSLSFNESYLIRAAAELQRHALYHTLRGTYHASPALLFFLISMIILINKIWAVVSVIVTIFAVIKAFHIDDLLYRWWPWYADIVDQIRGFIVETSEALGWGIDGLMHLVNAVQGGVSIYGGLTNKGEDWMKLQGLLKMEDTLKTLQIYAKIGYTDAGDLLGKIFDVQARDTLLWFKDWSGENLDKIMNVTGIAEKALRDAGSIGDELLAIRENMPQVIADNIPASIWSGLESFNNTIYNDILPTVSGTNEKLAEANRLIDMYADQMSNIARKLIKPGDLLLGVDNLPDYVRLPQEVAIDDVASREFQRLANEGRDALDDDLGEFDRIDAALKADTPEPVFMSLESPARAALTGIVAEPYETWFLKADL